MRTTIYVDGFNLYYGSLKGSGYKWLDLHALFSSVLQPHHQITRIKYFTARVSGRANDPDAPTRQDTYFRALRAQCPSVEIIEGHFLTHRVTMKLDPPIAGQHFAQVVKAEEKGSDVNLALHLLDDAWRGAFDSAVVVSNDSDLAQSLRMAKACRPKATIILITPGDPNERKTNVQLKKWASAVRYIPVPLLASSQLPNPVVIGAQSIHKPADW